MTGMTWIALLGAADNFLLAVLAAWGARFSRRGIRRGQGVLAHCLFWFFALTLGVSMINATESLLLALLPDRALALASWMPGWNSIANLIGQASTVLLVVGCGLAVSRLPRAAGVTVASPTVDTDEGE